MTELIEKQSKNFSVRLKASIEKAMLNAGMLDMILKSSNHYEHYEETLKLFFDSIGDITLDRLQGRN
jgi:hypothetical protein